MSGEAQLLLIITAVHILGLAGVAILLIPALRDGGPESWGSDSGSDDGWGHGPPRPPEHPEPPTGGIPLPDAVPARVRLRDHRRLADLLPRRERRPAREPERTPVRTGA
jgi:hypothetical protein